MTRIGASQVLGFGVSLALIGLAPIGAQAGEVFGGVYKHDMSFVRDIFGAEDKIYETGEDFELGWRSEKIESWDLLKHPSIYVMTQINDSGNTNQADIGLTWKSRPFSAKKFYIRPSFGLAIHDGRLSIPDPDEAGISQAEHDRRVALAMEPKNEYASRVLFNPQFSVGYDFSERTSVEISWVHISHGGLSEDTNQGQDNLGVRFNYRY